MDVEQVLSNIIDDRKRLAFRMHMEGIPLDSKRTTSIAKVLGVSSKTAGQWIGEGRSAPLQEGVAALLGKITQWHGSQTPQDDISILAVDVSVASGLGEPGVTSLVRPHAPPKTR